MHIPFWFNVLLVILVLVIQLNIWLSDSRAFGRRENRKGEGFVDLWWLPKQSSFLMLLGAGYYVHDCLTHPPFGESRFSILIGMSFIGLGFVARNWKKESR